MTLSLSIFRCWPESALESSLDINHGKTFLPVIYGAVLAAMTSANSPLPAALRYFTAYADIRCGDIGLRRTRGPNLAGRKMKQRVSF
jgi:hypothetical protein